MHALDSSLLFASAVSAHVCIARWSSGDRGRVDARPRLSDGRPNANEPRYGLRVLPLRELEQVTLRQSVSRRKERDLDDTRVTANLDRTGDCGAVPNLLNRDLQEIS